jgi:hypothetical protein
MSNTYKSAEIRAMMKFPATMALAIVCSITAATTHASDLLSLIVGQLSDSAVVRGDFVQEKQIAVLSRPIVSRGRVIVSRRDGLIWQIEAPLRMSIAFSDSRIIETDAAGNRRVHNDSDNRIQAEVGRVFHGLLAADLDILDRYFNLQTSGDVHHWRIDLTPRSVGLGKFIKTLQLSGGRNIETIRVEEPNSDTTLIRLLDVSTADSLSADEQALLSAP